MRISVSPLARKSKALALPELKFQARLPLAPLSALMAPLVTVSIALRAALFSGLAPAKVPPVLTDSTVAVTVSERSASTTVRVPLVVITALVSVMEAVALAA